MYDEYLFFNNITAYYMFVFTFVNRYAHISEFILSLFLFQRLVIDTDNKAIYLEMIAEQKYVYKSNPKAQA